MYDNLTFGQDSRGLLWAYTPGNAGKPILAPGHEYHNLFASSALLYSIMRDTQATLTVMLEAADKEGLDNLANAYQQLTANMNLACRCAEEGLQILS